MGVKGFFRKILQVELDIPWALVVLAKNGEICLIFFDIGDKKHEWVGKSINE